MALPADFVFTQSKLQDFADCARRFYLRYVLELRWPAPIADPLTAFEAHIEQGSRFHTLAEQYFNGLPPALITRQISTDDAALSGWWDAFLASGAANLPERHWPEISLSAELASWRLLAKMDLVAVDPDRLLIVDWKTSTNRPKQASLMLRWQTRLYRYLAVRAGAMLSGTEVTPEGVTMRYWFTEHPSEPFELPYSTAQYEEDEKALTIILTDISSRESIDDFPLTPFEDRCRFCNYRSLCVRGVKAGDTEAFENQSDLETLPDDAVSGGTFDFDQVAEVEF